MLSIANSTLVHHLRENKTRQAMPMKHISAEIFAHQLEEHHCLPSQRGSALRF